MLRFFVIILSLFFSSLTAAPNSHLTSQLAKGHVGDYIVTNMPGSYSVLIVHAKGENTITFEEINVPDYQVDPKKIDWKAWVTARAPGASSWTLLEVDLATFELTEAYSFTQRSFLSLAPEEQFLFTIFGLPMERLNSADRRRIGPPPLKDAEDHRPLWQPKIIFEGKPRKGPTSVFRAKWPSDNTVLAGSSIDLYFDPKMADFPFPIWIEVYGSFFKARVAILEAGHNLASPAPSIPRRPPQILNMPKKEGNFFFVDVYCSQHFDKLELFAIEASGVLKPGIPLLHEMKRIDKKTVRLQIPASVIDDRLEVGHRYRLALFPSGHRQWSMETDASFEVMNNKGL